MGQLTCPNLNAGCIAIAFAIHAVMPMTFCCSAAFITDKNPPIHATDAFLWDDYSISQRFILLL